MDTHTAYIAAGSNMGDKVSNCRSGINALSRNGDTVVTACSRYFKTEPVDYLDQDWFVNAVVKVETSLDPYGLLAGLQAIQEAAGRTQDLIRFGPRILDLDILFYDDLVVSTPELEIPHPRMHKRRFVLVPICDIDPSVVHPVLKKDMTTLLDCLDGTDQKVMPFL
jgi:2-amino-4-hydroxy-6-hydroxymethyldihydropteridine diphosphokinase